MYLTALRLALLLLPLPTTAILTLKLQNWFPSGSKYWTEAASRCEPQIQAYLNTQSNATCSTPCACAADCILIGLPGSIASNYASAQVVLGLIPAVLLLMGPSVAEVAVISTRRPLLAVLIALGCPTSYLGSLFRRVDPREVLKDADRSFVGTRLADVLVDLDKAPCSALNAMDVTRPDSHMIAMRRGHGVAKRSINVSVYLVALAAIANGVEISVYTDLRTISGWRCGALLMPMVWFLMGVIEQTWAMIAVRCQLWLVHRGSASNTKAFVGTEANPTHPDTGPSPATLPPSRAGSQIYAMESAKAQWTQSRLHRLIDSDLYTRLPTAEPTVWSEILFWLAQATVVVHMVFGIFVLSSLVFISALESVQVFARYAVNVVLCQVVVQIELATIRTALRRQEGQMSANVSGAMGPYAGSEETQGAGAEEVSHSSILGIEGSIRSHGSSRDGGSDGRRTI